MSDHAFGGAVPGFTLATVMYARAEQYRRRAIEARQRAGQTKDDAIQRSNFELIAESWIELAEQVEWLERKLSSGKGTDP
jgi:hypothetical protein